MLPQRARVDALGARSGREREPRAAMHHAAGARTSCRHCCSVASSAFSFTSPLDVQPEVQLGGEPNGSVSKSVKVIWASA